VNWSPEERKKYIDSLNLSADKRKLVEEQEKELKNQSEKPPLSSKNKLIGCGVLLGSIIILAVIIGPCLFGGETDTTEVTLNAEVVYDDGQFIITNNDDFAWTDVEFDLNYETWSSGYTYHANRLDANTIYTVGSMQFAKSDGTMFNPFTQKPLKMSIHCKTPDGKDGWWFGGWK